MRIYGGFEGSEKSINQRNRALIHITYKTTLSGDLFGDDTSFDFSDNRFDNSINLVNFPASGNSSYFDGFTVRGASQNGLRVQNSSVSISNSKFIDNIVGLSSLSSYMTVSNCSMMGNNNIGIEIYGSFANIKESLVVNNNVNTSGSGILNSNTANTNLQTTITNSTIVSNRYGIFISTGSGAFSTNLIKNTIIHGNSLGGITTIGTGTTTNAISYSLVQGNTGGTNGNLNGNTVNPQFVSPLPNNVISDAGDFRLKWCSKAIGAGNNAGISPLDLDRNPRNFNGTADMGAFEFLGNTPSQVNNSTITGTIDSTTYAGGGIQTVTSTAKILAPGSAIDFKAPNSITLNPGFEARGVGKYFKAEIRANQSCMNPCKIRV